MKTAKEYRDFFDAIPDNKWITGQFSGDGDCHCVRGHLGERYDYARDESTRPAPVETLSAMVGRQFGNISDAYDDITNGRVMLARINDNRYDNPFKQATPKARILAMCDALIAEGK